MGTRSLAKRLEWIESSASLRALNGIAIGLLIVGTSVLLVGLLVAISGSPGGGIVVAYVGGVLLGFGASTGILALAVNAVVGAIARATIDRDLERRPAERRTAG